MFRTTESAQPLPGRDELVLRARILLNKMQHFAFAECGDAQEVEGMVRELVASLETHEESERLAVANANKAWDLVRELAVIARRCSNPLLPGSEGLKADARAVLMKVEA